MRILVTGGAGYIGSFTVKLLLARGHEVWIYDNLSTGHRQAVPGERLVVADLDESHRLDQVLVEKRIEAVIHFAGSTYVGESVQQPAKYYRNNLVNSLQLLETCRRHGLVRFVFSSSAATYGIPGVVPIPEDHPQQPINPYGNTKLAVERALADHSSAYGLGCVVLRYFNAAGASADGQLGEHHDPETHLIPLAILAALGKRPALDIFGTDYPTPDGTCIRDYVHVEDLAEAHLLALERVQPGRLLCYNVGTGKGCSVREVIGAVEAVSGKKVPVRAAARRPGDPPILVAAADRIRRDLGWQPKCTDLHAIVATAWGWHSTHPKGYSQS